MTGLALAALFLPLSHFLISSTPLRQVLVNRLGEGLYSKGYSLLAFGAFAWLIMAYRGAPAVQLWVTPRWVGVALSPVILAASVLVAAGFTTPNPVIVRSERLFDRPEIVQGILRVSRNPFFWGASLCALAHVIILGDIAGLLAFGSVALLGIAGAAILDAKKARNHARGWEAFAPATADMPFLVIIQGRQRLVWREIGWWRIALGVGVFVIALIFYPWLFGGNPLGAL